MISCYRSKRELAFESRFPPNAQAEADIKDQFERLNQELVAEKEKLARTTKHLEEEKVGLCVEVCACVFVCGCACVKRVRGVDGARGGTHCLNLKPCPTVIPPIGAAGPRGRAALSHEHAARLPRPHRRAPRQGRR